MYKHENLSIKELPKRKKMVVDQQNPMRKIRQNKFTVDQQEKLNEISMTYGSAMAMMIRHDRAVLAEPQRLPGLRSSFMLLESNMGRLHVLEFQDVIGKDKNLMKNNAHDVYLAQFD